MNAHLFDLSFGYWIKCSILPLFPQSKWMKWSFIFKPNQQRPLKVGARYFLSYGWLSFQMKDLFGTIPGGQESFFKVMHLTRGIHSQFAIERSQIYTAISSASPDGSGPCIFTSIQMDSPLYLGRLNMDMDGWLSVCSFNKTGKLSIAKVHKGRARWINSKGMNNRALPKWPAGLKERPRLHAKLTSR